MAKRPPGGRDHTSKHFMQMVEGLGQGLLSLDRTLSITYANGAAARLLQAAPGDLPGRAIHEAAPAPLGDKISKKAAEALSLGSAVSFEELDHRPPLSISLFPSGEGVVAVFQDVTKEMAARRRPVQIEEGLRTLSDILPLVVIYRFRYEQDHTPRFEYISAGIERLTGIAPEKIQKRASFLYRQFVHDDLLEVMASEAHAHNNFIPFECRARLRHATTGEVRWVLMRSTPTRVDDGSTIWNGLVLDIDEQKRAEQALSENEAKFRFITEAISDVVWTTDLDFRVTYMSPSVINFTGFTPEERMAQDPREAMPPGSYARASKILSEELARDGLEGVDPSRSARFEWEFYCRDGSTIWTENIVSLIRDDAGKPTGIHGVSRDITEKKKAAEALKLSEQKFLSAFLSSPDPMVITDLDTNRIMDVNPAFQSRTGFTHDKIVGHDAGVLDIWVDPGARGRIIESINAGDPVDGWELKVRRKSGEIRDVLLSARLLKVGGRRYMFALTHDVTEEKAAAEKLRESEAKYRLITEKMRDVVWTCDRDLRCTYVSPSMEKVLGYTQEERMGRPPGEVVTPESFRMAMERLQQEEAREGLAGVDQDRPMVLELEFMHKNGSRVWMEGIYSAIRDESGEAVGLHAVCRDITGKRKAAEALRISEERFQSAFELSPDPMAITDSQTSLLVDANPAFMDVTGYSREEVIGQSTGSLGLWPNPDDRDRVFQRLKAGLPVNGVELQLRMKNGLVRDMVLSARFMEIGGRGYMFSLAHDVTEEKAAARELRESEAKFRLLTEKMSDVVWTMGMDFTITYISPSVEKVMGITPEERIALGTGNVMPPKSFSQITELFQEELARDGLEGVDPDRVITFDLEYDHKCGSTVWTENSVTAIRDQSGKVIGIHGVSRDITGKKKAAELLRLSEEKFQSVFEMSPDPMAITDLETGLLVNANAAFLAISDYSREEIIGHGSAELGIWVDPEDRRRMIDGLRAGEPVDGLEVRTHRKGAKPLDILLSARILSVGNREYLLTLAHDVTKEKADARKIRESEELLRSVSDNLPQIVTYRLVFDTRMKPHFEYVSAGIGSLLGVSREEALRDPQALYAPIHPDDLHRLLEGELRSLRELTPFECEVRLRHGATGEYRWTLMRSIPTRMEDGSTVWNGAIMDITEMKQAQEALVRANEELESRVAERTRSLQDANMVLEEQKEVLEDVIRMRERMEQDIRRLAAAIDQASDAIILVSPQRQIKYVNPAFEKMSGYHRGELMGKMLDVLEEYLQLDHFEPLAETMISEGRLQLLGRRRKRKNGEVFFANSFTTPVTDDAGKIIDYVTVARDVTRELNLQEQIMQIQKMDAVGAMAAGVAHDLRDTFAPILTNTRILLEHIRQEDPAHRFAGEILQETHKGLDLVDGLLTLSRSDIQEKRPTVLPDLMKEAMSILKSTMPSRLIVRYDRGDCQDTVLADPVQIKQVLINLGHQADWATQGDKGLLSIKLDRKELSAREARKIGPDLAPGAYARIRVRDTGRGMDEKTRSRVFDPFFYPGEHGERTGLGLHVVSGIIASHQGAITCASRPGKGTTFTVYLPVMPPS